MNKNFSFYKKIQIISAILISLFCGSPNAFNHLNSKIKDDQNYSENFMSQLASYGMVGLYFTIPAGILYDRIGPRFTSILGSILASGGYLLMSFIPGKFSMSFFFVIVGFGLGFSFIVSLGTAVKASSEKFRGFSVACVGSAMSLSMGLVVLIFQYNFIKMSFLLFIQLFLHFRYSLLFIILFSSFIFLIVLIAYEKIVNCDSDNCWKNDLRLIAILSFIFIFPLSFIHYREKKQFYKKLSDETTVNDESENIHQNENENENENQNQNKNQNQNQNLNLQNNQKITFRQSFLVFKNKFFYILALNFFTGVGYGIFVIAGAHSIWESYNSEKNWGEVLLTAFSLSNACGGILSGIFSDLFKRKGSTRENYLMIIQFFMFLDLVILAILTIITKKGITIDLFRFIFLCLIGFGFGTVLSIIPTIVGERFGSQNFGVYLGLLQIFTTCACLCVPPISSAVFQKIQNHSVMIFVFSGFSFFSSLTLYLFSRKKRN